MITFVVENVTEAKHRVVLNEMLSGGAFSYEARGEQKDAETFEIKLREGEYAIVRDELLDLAHEEMMEQQDKCYQDVHGAFPRTANIDDGDTVNISLNRN